MVDEMVDCETDEMVDCEMRWDGWLMRLLDGWWDELKITISTLTNLPSLIAWLDTCCHLWGKIDGRLWDEMMDEMVDCEMNWWWIIGWINDHHPISSRPSCFQNPSIFHIFNFFGLSLFDFMSSTI